MTDIVERILVHYRAEEKSRDLDADMIATLRDAAYEIKRLRAALEDITATAEKLGFYGSTIDAARKALKGET